MTEATPFLPGLSPLRRKPLTAEQDAGNLTSNGGLIVLRESALPPVMADVVPDKRSQLLVVHSYLTAPKHRTAEVRGSIPLGSTKSPQAKTPIVPDNSAASLPAADGTAPDLAASASNWRSPRQGPYGARHHTPRGLHCPQAHFCTGSHPLLSISGARSVPDDTRRRRHARTCPDTSRLSL